MTTMYTLAAKELQDNLRIIGQVKHKNERCPCLAESEVVKAWGPTVESVEKCGVCYDKGARQ